ncbi:MAG: hypothetical protein U0353_25495 [Sandaracinus sp.]
MSDDKKPKKDLRARLGKTIAPTTPGAPPIAIPGAVPGVAPAAAPAAAGDVAPPPIAPPPVAAPAIVAPPIAAPAALFGNDVAPPPFAQPAAPAAPPKPRPPADPFAAQAHQGPQEVRLVIDEKPVSDDEVGRQQRGRTALIAAICLVVGAALGAGGGSMNGRRALYNVTVRDGHDIFTAVDTASRTVLDAQAKVDACVTAAAGQGGQPHVDYASIEQLRTLENPLQAGAFARKNYGAFQPATVDDLFAYYNNVQQLWTMFTHLQNTTLPEARRAELDRTAQATGDSATAQYGAVLVTAPEDQGGQLMGQLAFLEEAPPEGDEPRVLARGTRGGPGRAMAVFAPGVEIGTTPTHVLLIDGAGSRGVLASQTGAFGEYVNEIREIKTLMDQTIEIQGRLTTSLGEIARLEEVFAL